MSLTDYLCASEGRSHYDTDYDFDYYCDGFYAPAIEYSHVYSSNVKTVVVQHSPYLDKSTNTWWQYDDCTGKYVDTGVKASIGVAEVNEILKDYDDDDEPLTLDEVKAILV